jgi:hypothetical protein
MDGVNHYVCPFVEACERVKLGLQSAKRKRAKKKRKEKQTIRGANFQLCTHGSKAYITIQCSIIFAHNNYHRH